MTRSIGVSTVAVQFHGQGLTQGRCDNDVYRSCLLRDELSLAEPRAPAASVQPTAAAQKVTQCCARGAASAFGRDPNRPLLFCLRLSDTCTRSSRVQRWATAQWQMSNKPQGRKARARATTV